MRRKIVTIGKKTVAFAVAFAMVAQSASGVTFASENVAETAAAEEVESTGAEAPIDIISLDYFNSNEGPVIPPDEKGVFNFCLPLINGEAIPNDQTALQNALDSLDILVKSGDEWVPAAGLVKVEIDPIYWSWGVGTDWEGGSWGFVVSGINESCQLRIRSKSNPDVYKDYTIKYPITITQMEFTQDKVTVDSDNPATGIPFDLISVNDGEYKGGDVYEQLTWYVKQASTGEYFSLDDPKCGFTWSNDGGKDGGTFGWDAAQGDRGGYWFNPIKESFTLRATYSSSVYAEIEIEFDDKFVEKGAEYDFSEKADENSAPDPGTNKEGYDLIWADEFGTYGAGANLDSNGLNLDNWAYQLGDGTIDCGNTGWGNSEKQAYTDHNKNLGVNEDINKDGTKDGLLRITASREDEPYIYSADGKSEGPKNYTSARIRTTKGEEALFTTTYGYIESRISIPETTSAWPAFWMLPQSTEIYGAWPVSGELDIMESTGVSGNAACSTLHYGAPSHVYKGSGDVEMDSAISNFHTYAVDWEPGKMTFYYDGKLVYVTTNWESGKAGASDSLSFDAPFDQPFYIILNLALDSGSFSAANSGKFEGDINMYVDYVRAYQKTGGYAESARREAASGVKDDWENYAGIAQIADIDTDNIIGHVTNGDVNSVETKGEIVPGSWYLAHTSDATTKVESYTDNDETNWAKVSITSAGNQDHSTQLIGHYNAEEGYVYKITFDAYAEGDLIGKKIDCSSKKWDGWITYGSKSFDLRKTATTYSFYVNQTESFDNCRLEFNLGNRGTGTAYIGNVKVEIVDPAVLAEIEGNLGVLPNGDIIYNGTFDQGNDHIGRWDALEGTTLKVPRYATEKLTGSDVSVVDTASTLNDFEPDAKANQGVKYYARRAQVSASSGVTPGIYQAGLNLIADKYTLTFDMYSANNTTVTASIYSVNGEELDSEVLSSSAIDYSTADGLKTYTWKFKTSQEVENAALVLSFGNGASVQIDNVSLLSESQAAPVDPEPMDTETTWKGLTADNGVYTLTNIVSNPANWYSPQLGSSQFGLAAGKTYKLSFMYKMEGTSNNKFQYIIQENGGSWTPYTDAIYVTYNGAEADNEGFCEYEYTFKAGSTLNNVFMNFGFGHSEADGATFSFKDVSLVVVEDEEEGDGNVVIPSPIAINYVLNGGKNSSANPLGFFTGTGTITLEDASRDGYVFLGWSHTEGATGYVKSVSTNTSDEITLYANWEERTDAATPVISTQPVGATYEVGATAAELKVVANSSDNGTLSYQWYMKTAVGEEAIAGAKAASYTPGTAAVGTTEYFCIVTNTNNNVKGSTTATAKSDVAKIVVTGNASTTVAVTGVRLNSPTLSLVKGTSATLVATVEPSNATNKAVAWSTSNPSVATVANGKVTAVSAGTANITVTTINGKTATCTVTVTNPAAQTVAVNGVILNKTSLTLNKGKSETLVATVEPGNATNKTVKWSTSNAKVATVDENTGKVKAVAKGTAKITATAGGKTAQCTVTVKVPSTKVKLNTKTVYMVKGKTLKIKATMTPKDTTDTLKISANTKKTVATATLKKNIITIKAKKVGKTVITVKTTSGKSVKCTINVVQKAKKSTKIKLNKKTLNITKGASYDLVPTLTPKTSTDTVKWTSSNKKIATVDEYGTVTGKKGGTVTITAKSSSGKKTTCKVTVKVKSTQVKLTKKTLSIKKGATTTLKAKMTPSDSTDTLKWSTSNKKIVTVDAKGKIKGIKKGTATITVKTSSGKKATCKVTVK